MAFIDTHAHLYLKDFEKDRDEVMKRAIQNGISKILLPNIDASTIRSLLDMYDQFPDHCYPMMGLHPGSVSGSYLEELDVIKLALNEESSPFIAVGEVGIDLYWDRTFMKEQTNAFRLQVQWSIEHELPLVIHSRDSFDQIYAILGEFKGKSLTGVFHSFTGNLEQARKALDIGFYIGINGIITFKNSDLDQLLGYIGLDRVILETDAPYLTPVPHRGKRNESSYLVYIAQKIAGDMGITREHTMEITTRNARDLFKLDTIT